MKNVLKGNFMVEHKIFSSLLKLKTNACIHTYIHKNVRHKTKQGAFDMKNDKIH